MGLRLAPAEVLDLVSHYDGAFTPEEIYHHASCFVATRVINGEPLIEACEDALSRFFRAVAPDLVETWAESYGDECCVKTLRNFDPTPWDAELAGPNLGYVTFINVLNLLGICSYHNGC
eukprot:gnl/Hemi2/20618_TR6842_c0_g1_i1.p2 gnl/Hemi2/20618_TR6842_c0_g1~~gnl/Hemi2/20618_TR6842_c0_g1_i1.p2  ORF type:complete len:119 (-),score=21.44 gnl/Hemi2/20618_TR6842_c0_g1_i1:87-443(-)